MANRFNQLLTVLFGLVVLIIMLSYMNTAMGEAFGPDRGVVALSVIESGKLRKSGYYAQVSGYAAAAPLVQRQSRSTFRYIPLRSSTNSTVPIHLVIKCRQSHGQSCAEPDPRTQMVTVQGYIEVADNLIPNKFKSGLKLARRVMYIKSHADRSEAKIMLLVVGGIGGSMIFGVFQALVSQV